MKEASHFLLIDDDDIFRNRLARALTGRKFKVSEANSVASARKLIEENIFDAIICDLKMPGESGLDFLDYAESNLDVSVPVLMLTGFGTISTAVEAMKRGCIYYLNKPVDLDTILEVFDANRNQKPTEQLNVKPMSLRDIEREHIEQTLLRNKGNITHSARDLGINRRSLQRKLNTTK